MFASTTFMGIYGGRDNQLEAEAPLQNKWAQLDEIIKIAALKWWGKIWKT